MTLYDGKYRIETTRVPGWDYRNPAWYFVTICTKDRRCSLSIVDDGELELTPVGRIIEEEWLRTATVRRSVTLDAHVIMPNHLYGILVIEPVETTRRVVFDPTALNGIQDNVVGPPRRPDGSSLQSGSLGAIVGQFKSVCTKRIRAEFDPDFGWQPRFYEHIIRNESSLVRIRSYIERNPATWQRDDLHPSNW